ncbi:HIT-family protein [Streptococcus pneumoniae]|nr:HIT-family protein [Streptococcus pneumoniae]
MECLGCKLAGGEEIIYIIYEDDYVTCFLDHAPFYPGHTLIVPKQHVVEVDELNDVVAKSVMDASKLIAKAIKIVYKPDGVTVCQNGGVIICISYQDIKSVRLLSFIWYNQEKSRIITWKRHRIC